MTGDMENLQNAVFLDIVPDGWTKQAYPSMCGLALWFSDLLLRIKELEAWSADFVRRIVRSSRYRPVREPTYTGCTWRAHAGTHRYCTY